MGIDEFMKHYGQQEIDKQRRLGNQADFNDDVDGSPVQKIGSTSVVGSAAFK